MAELAGIIGAGQARMGQVAAQRRRGRGHLSGRAASTYRQRAVRSADDPAAGRARHRAAAQPGPGRKRGRRRARARWRRAARPSRRARAGVAEARSTLAQAQQEWRAQAATELATAQAELAARSRALPALANRMERTVLRAPLAGRINRVLVTTSRRLASVPASRWSRSFPRSDSLLIEARVKPADIAFVRLGQHARVAITAYDRSVYGLLEGSVVGISPDAMAEERTGETYYIVRVRTTRERAARRRTASRCRSARAWSPKSTCSATSAPSSQYLLTPITRLGETAFREQ